MKKTSLSAIRSIVLFGVCIFPMLASAQQLDINPNLTPGSGTFANPYIVTKGSTATLDIDGVDGNPLNVNLLLPPVIVYTSMAMADRTYLNVDTDALQQINPLASSNYLPYVRHVIGADQVRDYPIPVDFQAYQAGVFQGYRRVYFTIVDPDLSKISFYAQTNFVEIGETSYVILQRMPDIALYTLNVTVTSSAPANLGIGPFVSGSLQNDSHFELTFNTLETMKPIYFSGLAEMPTTEEIQVLLGYGRTNYPVRIGRYQNPINDMDNDGIPDQEEAYLYLTNPNRVDTDGDGVSDYDELVQMTNPRHPMSNSKYDERSLEMGAVPATGITLTDTNRFVFGSDGWTVEMWVKPGNDGNGDLFRYGDFGTESSFVLSLEDYRPKAICFTKGTNILLQAGGLNDPLVGSIQRLPTNEWTHVAFIWSPKDRVGFEIYINGLLLIAQKHLDAMYFQGKRTYIAANFDDGYMDDLRVWGYDRPLVDIEYWYNRIYPAPTDEVRQPAYGDFLRLNYRFDDGGTNIVDFAHLNDAYFFIEDAGTTAWINDKEAVSLLGSDDEDGDTLPEWWTEIHNLEQYPIKVTGNADTSLYDRGPTFLFHDRYDNYVARIAFYKAGKLYTSAGGYYPTEGWKEPIDNMAYEPKDRILGFDGRYSSYLKYVYLGNQPNNCTLHLYTPGMLSTVAYINGTQVTTDLAQSNQFQVLEIANYLQKGRNAIYVKCESTYGTYLDSNRLWRVVNPNTNHWEGIYGKFDAKMVCDNIEVIRRGDLTKNDPRSVWFCNAWSTHENREWAPEYPDMENRTLPGNADYGLPDEVDEDGFDAYLEYLTGTNPRDRDTNNNGIPDGQEDFDGDGLVNADEQIRGSHPLLPDSDDDTYMDGVDTIGTADPSSPINPSRTRSLILPTGSTNDFVAFPKQNRFALSDWSLEAWINRDAADADGGVIVSRKVSDKGINYELGLGDGVTPIRIVDSNIVIGANVPYVRFSDRYGTNYLAIASNNLTVAAGEWTHLAATFKLSSREMLLYMNSTNVANSIGSVLRSPTIYAGGPVIQQIGSCFHGEIDEVRIWNTIRTIDQIQENFLESIPRNSVGLVAYYRFDDSTSYNKAQDIGTSGNNQPPAFTNRLPWMWGQVQDYVIGYQTDYWDHWLNAASLHGSATISSNGGGKIQNPPTLQVIFDDPAPDDGRWTVQGQFDYYRSGAILTDGLESGTNIIQFISVSGWTAPEPINVVLGMNSNTVIVAQYIRNGSLSVRLLPTEAEDDGAQWRVDNGVWVDSTDIVSNLNPQITHLVEFKDIEGWSAPSPITNQTVDSGLTSYRIVYYGPVLGSLRVYLEPQGARDNGASWTINGGGLARTHGEVVDELPLGNYTVGFNINTGSLWQVPNTVSLGLSNAVMVTVTGLYKQVTGISVNISPTNAIAEGAQWRVVGETLWHNSGDVVTRDPGEHTIEFKPINGWAPLETRTVNVTNDLTTIVSALYFQMSTLGMIGNEIGQFRYPRGMVYNTVNARLYVADTENNRIQIFNSISETWETPINGILSQPVGVGLDPANVLFITDTANNRIVKYAGSSLVIVGGSEGTGVGQFNTPVDLAFNTAGDMFVADRYNSRIQKYDTAGNWSVLISQGYDNGMVWRPRAIEMGDDTMLYIADHPDTVKARIQTFNQSAGFIELIGSSNQLSGKISNLALDGAAIFAADMEAHKIYFKSTAANSAWNAIIGSNIVKGPEGLALDDKGNLYISDTGNHRVLRVAVSDITNPSASAPPPAIKNDVQFLNPITSTLAPNLIQINWIGETGKRYSVEYRDSLDKPTAWIQLAGAVDLVGVDGSMSCVDDTLYSPARFYRVLVKSVY